MPNAGHDGTRNGKRKEGDKGSDNRVVVTRRGVDGRRVGRMTRKNPHRPKRRGGRIIVVLVLVLILGGGGGGGRGVERTGQARQEEGVQEGEEGFGRPPRVGGRSMRRRRRRKGGAGVRGRMVPGGRPRKCDDPESFLVPTGGRTTMISLYLLYTCFKKVVPMM
jgi:hypothetical protein